MRVVIENPSSVSVVHMREAVSGTLSQLEHVGAVMGLGRNSLLSMYLVDELLSNLCTTTFFNKRGQLDYGNYGVVVVTI